MNQPPAPPPAHIGAVLDRCALYWAHGHSLPVDLHMELATTGCDVDGCERSYHKAQEQAQHG